MTKKTDGKRSRPAGGNFEGVLRGFTDLVEKLGELAQKGETLSQTGEFAWPGKHKELKGVYGFSVKVGLGGEGLKVEPFGNIRPDQASGHSVVQEIREPMVDLFEEEDHLLLVAEMPGIGAEDVRIEVQDDLLTLSAAKADKKYRKEVLLPHPYAREKMQIACNNGMVEIKCTR